MRNLWQRRGHAFRAPSGFDDNLVSFALMIIQVAFASSQHMCMVFWRGVVPGCARSSPAFSPFASEFLGSKELRAEDTSTRLVHRSFEIMRPNSGSSAESNGSFLGRLSPFAVLRSLRTRRAESMESSWIEGFRSLLAQFSRVVAGRRRDISASPGELRRRVDYLTNMDLLFINRSVAYCQETVGDHSLKYSEDIDPPRPRHGTIADGAMGKWTQD